MSALPYLLALLIPLSLVFEILLSDRGTPYWYLVTPVAVLFVHPMVDRLLPINKTVNPSQSRIFTVVLWVQVPLLYLLTYFVLHRTMSMGLLGSLALAVGLGAANGAVGITVAHELIHRTAARERCGGLMLLALVNYMHYRIEHIFGHHKYVATPEDPATARRGESIYAFWWRCLPSSVMGAWKFERQRIESRRLHWYCPQNRMLQYAFIETLISTLVFWKFGGKGILVFWAQGLVAALFLELTNYIEHYGLVRNRLPNGAYTPATAAHSWDSYHRLSNWMLFNLGRHAHHHLRPTQKYQGLEPLEESPKLPQGYSGLILLVMIPPLWRRVMERRIPKH